MNRNGAMGIVMAISNPKAGPARDANAPPGASVDRLEQLRTILLRALDELESQARRRLRESALPPDDAEVARRLKELEAAQSQFRSEVDRWEHSRADQLEALDQDRRDLAEVWERIERLEIRGQPAAATPVPVPVQPRAHLKPGPVGPGSSLPPARRPAATSTSADSPVTRAVLEQFQVLRRDVRRKADGRSSG